jgi:valyl-tRNA synthetase
MPFITEEIWQRIAPLAGVSGASVMLAPYPRAATFPVDEAAESEAAWIQAVILGVRQIRGEMNISPGKRIPLIFRDASAQDEALIGRHRALLERLAGLESASLLPAGATAPQSAVALVGTLALLVPMAGLIDARAEAERLAKLIAKTQADLAKTQAKLANESFVRNAPPQVVSGERERAAELTRAAADLGAQLERLRGASAS